MNPGRPDRRRDGFGVVANPNPRTIERRPVVRRPLCVVDMAVGLKRPALPDALKIVRDPEIRLRLMEPVFQFGKFGVSDVGRRIRQDMHRLLKAFLLPEFVGALSAVSMVSRACPSRRSFAIRRSASCRCIQTPAPTAAPAMTRSAATRSAAVGRRRAHLTARSAGPTGRARIGLPSRKRERSSANSWAPG